MGITDSSFEAGAPGSSGAARRQNHDRKLRLDLAIGLLHLRAHRGGLRDARRHGHDSQPARAGHPLQSRSHARRAAVQGSECQRDARSVRGLAAGAGAACGRPGHEDDAGRKGRDDADRHAQSGFRRRGDGAGEQLHQCREDDPIHLSQRRDRNAGPGRKLRLERPAGDARAGSDVDQRDPATGGSDPPRHPGCIQVQCAQPL